MNNKKSIIALLLIAIIGIVGLTIAYFANSTDVENTFTTKEYGTTYTESFVSPDNWLPGDTTEKTLVATNTGEVDQAVRVLVTESWTTHNSGSLNGWIHSDGTKSTHESASELETDERVAVLNLANTSDWTPVGNYYYYNYKLAPGESTSSFLESVTFNSKTKLDDTCTTSTSNGVTTTTCNSSGDDYDNATYTLTLTIETVQYNKYVSAWNTGSSVTIATERPLPASQYLANNATNPAGTEYNTDTKGNMFTFSHTVNGNTVNETRYIGDEPKNYVKFNCDDDGTNCETWRILGVFDVDDGTGNVEQRMKLVRGSAFATPMYWNTASNGNGYNDWTADNATLKLFLNGDYYNRTGGAATYGLKASAKSMIGDAVYNLGAFEWNSSLTTEQLYTNERGTTACGACNSDSTKTTWTGKVALMYPSDNYMVYGNGVNATCYDNPDGCYGTEDATTGWVYNSNIREGQSNPDYTWLLSTYSGNTNLAFTVNSTGSLSYYLVSYTSRGVRPVVYLKSNIKIADGTGEAGSPYVLEAIQ